MKVWSRSANGNERIGLVQVGETWESVVLAVGLIVSLCSLAWVRHLLFSGTYESPKTDWK